jgi:hypothetical protein
MGVLVPDNLNGNNFFYANIATRYVTRIRGKWEHKGDKISSVITTP